MEKEKKALVNLCILGIIFLNLYNKGWGNNKHSQIKKMTSFKKMTNTPVSIRQKQLFFVVYVTVNNESKYWQFCG